MNQSKSNKLTLCIIIFLLVSSTSFINIVHAESIPYSIIKDNAYRNNIKRSVDIRLQSRITKDQLTKLAQEIKKRNHNSYKRTFILYYLPGMQVDSGAWASTHFNPNLEVRIIGASIEQARKLKTTTALKSTQTLIGNYFHDLGSLSHRITLVREKNKIFMIETYLDGSQGTKELKESKVSRGLRLDEIQGNNEYYYVINKNDSLETWDAQGMITSINKFE